jgi:hypothetical protein
MVDEWESRKPDQEKVESLRHRLGAPDPLQVVIWQAMTGAQRLELVGQAYRLALETVRASERSFDPDVSPAELDRRIICRVHGSIRLREDNE